MNFKLMMTPSTSPLSGVCALVTDGDQRTALAVVRSLGVAGARVIVGSTTGVSLAGASRFAASEVQLPSPLEHPELYVARLRDVVDDYAVGLLLPITEASVRPVLAAEQLFACTELPFPTADVFAHASDKRRISELAVRLGIPVPQQCVIESPAGSDLSSFDLPSFPLVLKPTVSVAQIDSKQTKLLVRHIGNAETLVAALANLPVQAYPVLLQERILGPGVGLFLLRWDGKTIARFAHRRIREKPPSGGVSVYRESISPLPEVVRYGEKLLAALDWHGVAMVEFKLDRDSGTPYLMEINGRFWGSLQLAIDSGVDFPLLLAQAVLGVTPADIVEGKQRVRLRWLLGDLDHVLLRLFRSREELDLEPDAPGRFASLGAFVIPWRPRDRFEVCRLSDFRPFLRELRGWVSDVAS